MSALRLICFVSGPFAVVMSAVVAFAPGLARAQDAVAVEVTSDVVVDVAVPDTLAFVSDAPVLDLVEEEAEVSALAPARSLRPSVRDSWAVPAARWDDHPNGSQWTAAVLSALRGPGAPLLNTEPRDIGAWCPGYLEATPEQRAAFWTGLISTLAWHESTHRPRAVGGGGRWFGLVQIAPGTARWRDCDVGSGEALLNGAANLRCGIRIMAITVPRDDVVAEGMRGVAADWGPFHSARKREDMRNWVRQQPYCQAPVVQMRPVMRPTGLGEGALDVVSRSGLAGGLLSDALRPVPRPSDR